MTTDSNLLENALKANGYSLTVARRSVYRVLVNNEPLTMAELLTACPATINRASVYRCIQLFEKLGIVQRLQIGWKYRLELSNNFQDHHHHLTCLACGTVAALGEDDLLEDRLHKLAQAHNFQPQDHQLEIRGLCQNCQATVSL